jgi:hypothetical protein
LEEHAASIVSIDGFFSVFMVYITTLSVTVVSDKENTGRTVEGSGRRLFEATIHAVALIE